MPPRPLETAWPPTVDSTAGPTTGTRFNKDFFDSMMAAVRDAIYDPSITEGPPDIAAEVVGSRGSYANLDARLDAIAAAAAGGAATSKTAASLNFVWNDTLLWSGGDSAAPDGWSGSGITIARIAAQPTPGSGPATAKAGRNIVALTNPDATPRDFYFDVVTGTALATHGNAPLAGASWAGGIHIYSPSVSGLVTVWLEDANGSLSQIGQQGATTGSWVWSANGAYDGGRTLGASPTRLRLIVRMTAAGTAYLCGAMCGPGEKSPYYVPPPVRRGQWTFGLGPEAQLTTGIKSRFYVNRYAYVYGGRVLVVTAGAASGCTVTLEKGGVDIFNTALVVAATNTDSTAKLPHTVAKASVKPGDLMEFRLSAVATDLRGVTAAIDYLEPEILTDALFGGSAVF